MCSCRHRHRRYCRYLLLFYGDLFPLRHNQVFIEYHELRFSRPIFAQISCVFIDLLSKNQNVKIIYEVSIKPVLVFKVINNRFLDAYFLDTMILVKKEDYM